MTQKTHATPDSVSLPSMIVLHAYPTDDRPLRMFTTVVVFLFFKKKGSYLRIIFTPL